MATEQVTEKPEMTQMVVSRDLAKQIKAIAERHGLTMSGTLEKFAGSVIAREYRKVVEAEYAKVVGGEG